MIWVNIIAGVVLLFALIGGLKDGTVKSFFSLIELIIAIPLAGVSYRLLATLLSFLPGENLENFIGFFITLGVISVILHLIFLIPRKFIQKVWNKGGLFRLIGGAITVLKAAIGLVVFALLLGAYPIFGGLEQVVTGSGILNWLVAQLSFVQAMLPEIFRDAATSVAAGLLPGVVW